MSVAWMLTSLIWNKSQEKDYSVKQVTWLLGSENLLHFHSEKPFEFHTVHNTIASFFVLAHSHQSQIFDAGKYYNYGASREPNQEGRNSHSKKWNKQGKKDRKTVFN